MCIGYMQTLCHFVEGTSASSNFGILGGHKTDLHRYQGMSELSYYAYYYLNLVSHSSRLPFFSLSCTVSLPVTTFFHCISEKN